jgi:hypothetical protein
MEVWSGCIASIFAGLFFVFWYAVFQRFLQATDVVVNYNWSYQQGTDFYPNFDIRNRSKSRTYLLANIAYFKQGSDFPFWLDNKSLWGIELKPGSINFLKAATPVKDIRSINDSVQVQIRVRIQMGREFPGAGPGQERKRVMGIVQWLAFRLRELSEKHAITLE